MKGRKSVLQLQRIHLPAKMITRFLVVFLCCLQCYFCMKSEEKDSYGLLREYFPFKGLGILSELNPTQTDDGKQIVEGDIVLPRWTRKKQQERKGIINIVTLWTNGKISYNFHSSIDDDLKVMIVDAMAHWENHTCLKFTEKNLDFSYLRFRADKIGCSSMIGRINGLFAGQDVSIGKGCNRSNIIIHEIGHAIGFYHEQSRNDRNNYIYINWNNMPVARYSQFDRGLESSRGVEYDYTSIMHYGPMAFTEAYFQKNTIAALNIHHQTLIGSGMDISFRDAKTLNKMYSCSAGCPNRRNESQCQNGGFLSPYREDDQPCTCVCPPHSSGEFCQDIEEPFQYYEYPSCGGNITEDTEIQTPGYPSRKPPGDSCSWWIQNLEYASPSKCWSSAAPEGKRVRVEFLDFSFHPRMESNNTIFNRKCVQERVEIRTRHRFDGDMFCGEDIPPGTVATSAGQEFIIIIDTNEKAQVGRGLKAKVTFMDKDTEEYKDWTLRSLIP